MSDSPPSPPDAPRGDGPQTPQVPLGIPTGFGPSGRAGAPPIQRVRLTFTKEAPLRFIGHLDLARAWERVFRRARLPLAYTLGFTPHPRLTFATPLALGATSGGELLDVFLRERVEVTELVACLEGQLPAGCAIRHAEEVPLESPSLNASVRWAEYRVEATAPLRDDDSAAAVAQGSRWMRGAVGQARDPHTSTKPDGKTVAELDGDESEVPWRPLSERLAPPEPDPPLPPRDELLARVDALLGAAALPRERVRDGKNVTYDLRPLVHGAALGEAAPDGSSVELRLVVRLDASGAGRPDEICAALGLRARRVHRVRLGLEGEPVPTI